MGYETLESNPVANVPGLERRKSFALASERRRTARPKRFPIGRTNGDRRFQCQPGIAALAIPRIAQALLSRSLGDLSSHPRPASVVRATPAQGPASSLGRPPCRREGCCPDCNGPGCERRIILVRSLSQQPRNATQLAETARTDPDNLKSHLRLLKASGWIAKERKLFVLRPASHPVMAALLELL